MNRVLIFLLFFFMACKGSNLGWRKVEFDLAGSYKIEFEDSLYLSDFDLPNDTIRTGVKSNLIQ